LKAEGGAQPNQEFAIMVSPIEIMPVLLLVFAISGIPLLADGPLSTANLE
jgi:hypothetical protein